MFSTCRGRETCSRDETVRANRREPQERLSLLLRIGYHRLTRTDTVLPGRNVSRQGRTRREYLPYFQGA